MSLRNQITSNFPEIAIADANGTITGLQVQTLDVSGNADLGTASSTTISGGVSGETLTVAADGTLDWVTPQLNQTTGFINTTRTTSGNLSIGNTTVTINGPYASSFAINSTIAFSASPTNFYVVTGRENLVTGETDVTFSAAGYYATGSSLAFFGNHAGTGPSGYDGRTICNQGFQGTLQTATLGTGTFDILNNRTTFPVTAGNVYNPGTSPLQLLGNGRLTLGSALAETVASGSLIYQPQLDPFSVVQFGNTMSPTNVNQLLTINVNPNLSITSLAASGGISAASVSANNITSNNVGATVVYSGLVSDMSGQNFPFATWTPNPSSGVNYNTSAANIVLANAGDFFGTTSTSKAVYNLSFTVATTGYTASSAAAYVSVINGATTSNVLSFMTGSTFNGVNYYHGSATVALDPSPNGSSTGGTFAVRLRTPTPLGAGSNISANGTMIITRIR